MAYRAFLFPRYSELDAEYSRPDEQALCSAPFPAERNAMASILLRKVGNGSRRLRAVPSQPTNKSADMKTVCGVA